MHLDIGNPKVDNQTNILDIKVPKEMEHNVRTGVSHLDMLHAGDGMTPSTVALWTGIPGTGKSTLALQLADALHAIRAKGEKQTRVLYNTGEESLYQIRKTLNRLNPKHGFNPGYHEDVDDLIKRCESIIKEEPGKQFFLIQDSAQTLEVAPEPGKKGRPLGEDAQTVEAIRRLTAFAKRTFSIVIMIGQVTKGGIFAGKNKLMHMIDCHLHLSVDMDKKSETYGQRVAEMKKNRFGPSGFYYPFQLRDNGFVFLDDADFGMAKHA